MLQVVDTIVDLELPVRGQAIPANHGYALFGALCRVLPWLHADEGVGVHPIPGKLAGSRSLALTPASRLTLRIPASLNNQLRPLSRQLPDLDGSPTTVCA